MRLKIVAAAVVLSIAAGIGLLWWMREHRPISAQELLREAAAAGKPTVEILTQQAGQGYYDDAMATARLIEGQPGELAVAVVRIRAENGDIREVRVSPAADNRLPKANTPRKTEAL